MPVGLLLATLATRSVEIPFAGDEPPTEFRLFKAGSNDTTKGPFLFDDAAAKSVMSSERAHDVDLMVDLEHLSLDTESRSYDPDARAWLRLEVRPGPELWAVNVRWTEDGARRLRAKTQRYISPAFAVDDDNRVIEIVNIALTAMPATHGTPALVAANRRPKTMTLKDRINALSARLSIAKGKIAKLADDGGDAPTGKAASVKAACEKASAALDDLQKAFGGSDIDATFAAMDAAKAAMSECEAKIDAMTGGGAPAPSDVPAPEATSQVAADPEKTSREKAELIQLRKEKAQRAEDEKVAKLAAEMAERADIEAKLVKMGRETPASVKLLAGLSIEDMRKRVEMFEGSPAANTLGRVLPPTGHDPIVDVGPAVQLSAFEVERVKAYADKRKVELTAAGLKPIEPNEVLERYRGHREQQFRGAKTDEQVKRLGRRIEQGHVMLSSTGKLVTLASTPVKPIEEFGASSQRALEEYRMNYNLALAAEPKAWAETIGDMMASGSVNKDTYPINLSATRYVKKNAQGPAAETSLNYDISVTKDEFYAGEEVELRRLVGGDFAHVLSWNRRAERMARARVFLRNTLVTTVLEGGESGYWGSSTELANGIDGQPFFSATHKVHPRDASKKLRGVATWSNFQSSAKVLNAVNLTGEKVTAFQVADPTGHEFGFEYDQMLVPSSLNEVAKNLISVQDLIIEAGTVNGVSNAFAATKNPHFQSGMDVMRGPDLAGTDTSADWYLISRAGTAMGLYPWLISEDGAEDLRTWDESSDFYKDSGLIKVTSHIYLAAALLFPHAIRKVSGT